MGQLYDREKWEQCLPPAVVTALMVWLDGKAFSLRHREWFDDGRSGQPVARVVRERDDGGADQRVLKFFDAGGAAGVANIRLASRDASPLHKPSDFGKRHIAEVENEAISLDGWSAVFLHIASGNLDASQQLGELFHKADFSDYCTAVVHSVLTEWNDNRVSRQSRRTADILMDIMGRRRDHVLAWAVQHGFHDGPPLVAMKGWPRHGPGVVVI